MSHKSLDNFRWLNDRGEFAFNSIDRQVGAFFVARSEYEQ
jgi:hypothetical protein